MPAAGSPEPIVTLAEPGLVVGRRVSAARSGSGMPWRGGFEADLVLDDDGDGILVIHTPTRPGHDAGVGWAGAPR